MAAPKRLREPPSRYTESDEPSKCKRGVFSDEEDAQLHSALLMHGPLDISKLTAMIPTRTEYQVKQRILSVQRKAQQTLASVQKSKSKGKPSSKVPLDQWIDDLLNLDEKAQIVHGAQEELHVRMLPTCMNLIAKYEDHPKPEECGGVNLKNVYGFLEHMTLGLPYKNLRNEDAKFLLESLQRLSCAIDNSDVDRETEFLMCAWPEWRFMGRRLRTYAKRKDHPSDDDEDDDGDERLKIVDSSKFNPFKVPKRLVKRIEPLELKQ